MLGVAQDYAVESNHGVNVTPHVASVSYFCDVGAPTIVMPHTPPHMVGQPVTGAVKDAWLSYPQMGKVALSV